MKNIAQKSFARALLFAGLCLAALQVSAGEVPVEQCPQTLAVQHILETPVSDGWKTVITNDPLRLKIIGISHGEIPVEQTGANAPEQHKILPNGDEIFYYITKFAGAYHTEEGTRYYNYYWTVCNYASPSIYLTRKIPGNAKRCEVLYRSDPLATDKISIKCFDTPRKKK
jgi:hypothetical protein